MTTTGATRFTSVALLATGLLLLGTPTAAFAHTDGLYSWANTGDDGTFATVDKSDAQLEAILALASPDQVTGMEICDENGYAVGYLEGDAFVLGWNHSTGEVSDGPTLLTADPTFWAGSDQVTVTQIVELDTTADCTLLSIAEFEIVADQDTYTVWAVSTVDPETGLTEQVVVIPPFTQDLNYTSVATDPLTGITYLFLEVENDLAFVVLDLAGGTMSSLSGLNGVTGHFSSDGFPQGADFDAAGTLWLIAQIDDLEQYRLLSLAGPAANLESTAPTDIGSLPYIQMEPINVDIPVPLTVDPAEVPVLVPDPVLPATGASDAGIGYLGAALLVAGLFVAFSRQRTA